MMVAKVRGRFGSFTGTHHHRRRRPRLLRRGDDRRAASIHTNDDTRDEHLRSADFFDVANASDDDVPVARRRAQVGDDYRLTGDLTIKGTSPAGHARPRVRRCRQGPVGQHHASVSRPPAPSTARTSGWTWNAPLETRRRARRRQDQPRPRGRSGAADRTRHHLRTIAMNVQRLNHAVLWVRDAQASAAFYGGALGFVEVETDPSGRAVFMRAGGSSNHHDLGLFSVGSRPSPPPQSPGLYHLAWQVATIDDLASVAHELTAARRPRRRQRPRRVQEPLRQGPGRHRVRGHVAGAGGSLGRLRRGDADGPARPQRRTGPLVRRQHRLTRTSEAFGIGGVPAPRPGR